MKVYVIFQTEFLEDNSAKVIMKGVFSSAEKAVDFVNELYLTGEIEAMFDEDEHDSLVIDNHNNGYLEAYINDGYHNIIIDFKEIEMDYMNVSNKVGIFNVI